MAADKAWRMGKWCRVFFRYTAVFLGVADEGVKVVTDNFRHAGGGDGNHLRLVQCLGIFQAGKHVLLATEYRRVFCHGVRHAGNRLLEVTVEVGAEVGHATLGTVNIGHGFFKAQCAQYGTERLAGLGRVDGNRFTLKVKFLVLFSSGPLENFLDLFLWMTLFVHFLFLGQVVLVLVITEQGITGLDIFY